MPDYIISKISEQPPKEWQGEHGMVYYIKVMLDGHPKPVTIGKKRPDALRVGDTVYGDIVPTDFPEDKFKAAPPQQNNADVISKLEAIYGEVKSLRAEIRQLKPVSKVDSVVEVDDRPITKDDFELDGEPIDISEIPF